LPSATTTPTTARCSTSTAAREATRTVAIGGRLVSPDGEVQEEFSDTIGTTTNNVAEYQALIAGLELALDRNVSKLTVHSDSELICRQLTGATRSKTSA